MEDVFLRVSPEKAGIEDDEGPETNGNTAMKIGELKLMDENHGTAKNGYGAVEYRAENGLKSDPIRSYNRLTGFDLWLGQMRGLLTKRAIYTLRRWLLYTCMVR